MNEEARIAELERRIRALERLVKELLRKIETPPTPRDREVQNEHNSRA